MENFTFHNPTKIVFGTGNLPSIGEETKPYGKKALLVYGQKSIKKLGVYDQVVDALKKANIEIIEHPGVKPNPVLSHAREGVEKCKSSGVDVIVAAGGGSVIDEAKSIAAGAVSDADVWDFFMQKVPVNEALPLIDVLTMPATGTEMNGSMVITNEENQVKSGFVAHALHPKVSFLDPSLTYSIPKETTAHACTDMIAHLVEGYFNSMEEFVPVVDGYIEGIIRGIMKSADRVMEKPDDYDGRANIMWGATLAWNGIGQRGFKGAYVPCHMMEHPLSGIYDIAHGAGLSIVIPAWMKYKKEDVRHRIELFGRNVMGIDPGSTSDLADTTIKELEKWYRSIGTPVTFQEAGIEDPDYDALAEQADFLSNYMGVPGYTKEDIKSIYRLADEKEAYEKD
ncbi:MAG: iron-containing alcohol dehydrogenase [Bacteroidales bacterium]